MAQQSICTRRRMCSWAASQKLDADRAVLPEVAIVVEPQDLVRGDRDVAPRQVFVGLLLKIDRTESTQARDMSGRDSGNRGDRGEEPAHIQGLPEGKVVGMKETFTAAGKIARAKR